MELTQACTENRVQENHCRPGIPRLQKKMDGTQGTGLSCQDGDCQCCPPFHNSGSPQPLRPHKDSPAWGSVSFHGETQDRAFLGLAWSSAEHVWLRASK